METTEGDRVRMRNGDVELRLRKCDTGCVYAEDDLEPAGEAGGAERAGE